MVRKVNKLLLAFTLLTVVFLGVFTEKTQAAMFGMNAVNNGNGTVTVTIYGNCVGGFTVSAGGVSANVAKKTLDSNASVTLTTGAGTFTVTVTAISVSDANYNEESGTVVSKSLTVTNGSSNGGNSGGSSGGNNGGNVGGNSGSSSNGNYNHGSSESGSGSSNPSDDSNTQEDASTNLSLSSLSVSEGTLSPTFSASVSEYKVSLPRGKKVITVKATINGTGANVSGVGEHKLKAGNNTIEVTVKEMDGDGSKTYTIHVYVEEDPTIFLDGAGKKKMGILSLSGAPVLEGFEDYTLKIKGKEVKARKNPLTGIVVLYMEDGTDSENYYIYDEKKKAITSIYIPVALLGKNYAIITIPESKKIMAGLTFKSIEIDKIKMDGWVFEDKTFSNYVLVYLMDEKGEKHLYQYEKSENVLQLYSGAAAATQKQYDQTVKGLSTYRTISFILIPVSVVLAFISLFLAVMRMKKRY